MKKIIFTVALTAFFAGANAQDRTKTQQAGDVAPAGSAALSAPAPAAKPKESSSKPKGELSNMESGQAAGSAAPAKGQKSVKSSGQVEPTLMPDGTAVPASNGQTTKTKSAGNKARSASSVSGAQPAPAPAPASSKASAAKPAGSKENAPASSEKK
jgi:hypothetical protein